MNSPFEDKAVIEAYIDDQWNDVMVWCEDRNLNPNTLANWVLYCIANEMHFLEFAYDYALEYEEWASAL